MKKYLAQILNITFEIERTSPTSIIFNGEVKSPQITRIGPGRYTLHIDNKIFDVSIVDSNPIDGTHVIYINGKPFSVKIDDEKTLLLKRYELEKSTHAQSAVVKAPMPGRITKVLVEDGECVEEGQGIVILEAMKMENEIKSPSTGIIHSIKVKEMDAVEKNAVLIEISSQ